MKKFAIQITVLILVLFGALYLVFKNYSLLGQSIPNTAAPVVKNITVGQSQISVEVADNMNKRSQGLGGRSSLDPNSGMLFIFDKSDSYKFWMKGMQFPLDMIFIQANKVVDIVKNAPIPIQGVSDNNLPRFSSTTSFDKVLEVNAGFVDAHQIKIGDLVTIP